MVAQPKRYLQSMGRICALLIAAAILVSSVPKAAAASATTGYQSNRIIHVKLDETKRLSISNGAISGSSARLFRQQLGKQPRTLSLLFERAANRSQLDNSYRTLKSQGNTVAPLSNYIAIDLGSASNTKEIAKRLKSVPGVLEAYPKPLPTPSPATPNLSALQKYRNAAPTGIDATFASKWPNGTGAGVKIVDIEYSWNAIHEDLAPARASNAVIKIGTPADPFNDSSHGTATLGIMSAQSNGYGMTGITPAASIGMANAYSLEDGWNPAAAVYAASEVMKSGDVLLLEQQAWGPAESPNAFVPIEWIPEVYDAIRYATAKNIMVVEVAGNGYQNLDDSTLYGKPFPAGKAHSGAFIVGAGSACTSPVRSRLVYSNYGSRVDFQGPGDCVATTGWNGDAYSAGSNASYTKSFSGTSAAAPVVASAIASFVASYKKLNGTTPSIAVVRDSLKKTGTAQNTAAGSLSGTIGPQPNLAKALILTDRKAPSAPTNLSARLTSTNKPKLSWTASKDNVLVSTYKIYRNSVLIKTIPANTSYTDTTASARRSYTYTVKAVDQAGRTSASSNSVTIRTR